MPTPSKRGRDPVRVARAKRDMQILTCLKEGFTLRQIADAYGVSTSLVWLIKQRVPKAGASSKN